MTDGYSQVYDSAETSEAVIDLLITILVVMVGLGSLIGLVLLFNWFKGMFKGTF